MFGSTVSFGATVGDGKKKKRELGFGNKKAKNKKLKVENKN